VNWSHKEHSAILVERQLLLRQRLDNLRQVQLLIEQQLQLDELVLSRRDTVLAEDEAWRFSRACAQINRQVVDVMETQHPHSASRGSLNETKLRLGSLRIFNAQSSSSASSASSVSPTSTSSDCLSSPAIAESTPQQVMCQDVRKRLQKFQRHLSMLTSMLEGSDLMVEGVVRALAIHDDVSPMQIFGVKATDLLLQSFGVGLLSALGLGVRVLYAEP